MILTFWEKMKYIFVKKKEMKQPNRINWIFFLKKNCVGWNFKGLFVAHTKNTETHRIK
jgi:hypothetical protein